MKYLLLIASILIFTGCDSIYGTHHSATFCKNNNYKGMLITDTSSAIYCTNGEKSQRNCWITLDGEKCDSSLLSHYFLLFSK